MAQDESSQGAEPSDGHMLPARVAANHSAATNERAAGLSPAPQPSDILDRWLQILAAVYEAIRQQIDFVLKSLLVLWNISLLIGGLIFIVYFWSIGFMPEIDVHASITLLAASAMTGVLVVFSIILSLVAPSYVWRWWALSHNTLQPFWSDNEGKRLPRPLLWFGLPLVGFLAGVFLILLLPQEWHYISFQGGFWLSPIIATAILWWKLPPRPQWRLEGGGRNWKLKGWWLNLRRKIGALTVFWGSVFVSAATIVPLILLVDRLITANPTLRGSVGGPVFIAIAALLLIVLFNAALVSRSSSSAAEYGAVVAFFTFIFFLMLGVFTSVPKIVMYTYQFGFIPASLVLDDVGCTIMQDHEILKASDKQTCRIPQVMIYSRLGSTYYVQANHPENKHIWVCLTLPREHVLSWSISKPEGDVWPPEPCISHKQTEQTPAQGRLETVAPGGSQAALR